MEAIKKLNDEICAMHNAHFKNSRTGLVEPNGCPQTNTIYHLYDNGEVTYQKGGFAYLQRSEFQYKSALYPDETPYKFPERDAHGSTYAALTLEEAIDVRQKMLGVIMDMHQNPE
jgi:hypothetical protein